MTPRAAWQQLRDLGADRARRDARRHVALMAQVRAFNDPLVFLDFSPVPDDRRAPRAARDDLRGRHARTHNTATADLGRSVAVTAGACQRQPVQDPFNSGARTGSSRPGA